MGVIDVVLEFGHLLVADFDARQALAAGGQPRREQRLQDDQRGVANGRTMDPQAPKARHEAPNVLRATARAPRKRRLTKIGEQRAARPSLSQKVWSAISDPLGLPRPCRQQHFGRMLSYWLLKAVS